MKPPIFAATLLFAVVLASSGAAEPNLQELNDACDIALRAADYQGAGKVCVAADKLAQEVTPGTPEQATALGQLALLRADQGRYEEAIALAQRATAIVQQVFGAYDPATVPALRRQALIQQLRGESPAAETTLLQALNILKLSSTPDMAAIAELQQRLGQLYYATHRYAESQAALEAALVPLESYYGSDDPHVTDVRALIERAQAAALRPDAIPPAP